MLQKVLERISDKNHFERSETIAKTMEDIEVLRTAWREPKLVAKSDQAVRPDQNNSIDASEYLDDPETLASKAKAVALLLKASNHCVVYTGAGISKSSGIADYATRAIGSIAATSVRLRNPLEAQPTAAHDALASAYRAGYIKEFVNQNHDGLFEKSGVSVQHSNLIHGDWYDIANPVVQFSGTLRGDLFQRLLQAEKDADLAIVAGTSLSGMNADRIAHSCAKRYQLRKRHQLGVVLVNLQRTALDEQCTVRVWSKTDDFFPLVTKELGVEIERIRHSVLDENVFFIPYDENGSRLPPGDVRLQVLSLTGGSRIKIVNPHASNVGTIFEVNDHRDKEGNWQMSSIKVPNKIASTRTLGRWYITAMVNGELEQAPCLNTEIKYVQRLSADTTEPKAN